MSRTPPKRRWSEQGAEEDEERPRKRSTHHQSNSSFSSTQRESDSSTQFAPKPFRKSPSSSHGRVQLPPIQNYLRDPHGESQLPSSSFVRTEIRSDNVTGAQASHADATEHSRPWVVEDQQQRIEQPWKSSASTRIVPRQTYVPSRDIAPIPASPHREWGRSPSHLSRMLQDSAPQDARLPPPPGQDEHGRSYSDVAPVPSPAWYTSTTDLPWDRRYSSDPNIYSSGISSSYPPEHHAHTANPYIWDASRSERGPTGASFASVANPNGRKRRGNLPKESTAILNDWWV